MKKALKWIGIILGSLVGLVVVALAVVYGLSEARLRKTYNVAASALTVPSDPETVARGRHIAVTRGCTDCHGENFAGDTVIDVPPVARLFATNLTRGEGGVAQRYRGSGRSAMEFGLMASRSVSCPRTSSTRSAIGT